MHGYIKILAFSGEFQEIKLIELAEISIVNASETK